LRWRGSAAPSPPHAVTKLARQYRGCPWQMDCVQVKVPAAIRWLRYFVLMAAAPYQRCSPSWYSESGYFAAPLSPAANTAFCIRLSARAMSAGRSQVGD